MIELGALGMRLTNWNEYAYFGTDERENTCYKDSEFILLYRIFTTMIKEKLN